MDVLDLDYETFSKLNLKKVGTSRYAKDRSTLVLMGAYSLNAGRVKQWVPAEGEPVPRELREAVEDPEVLKQAWSAHFEWAITAYTLGWHSPIEQWKCLMVQAMTLSFPGSLGAVGPIIDIPPELQKDPAGDRLIHKFTKPRTPSKNKPWTRSTYVTDPDDWDLFLRYNRQDVRAEQAIDDRLFKYDLPWHEWEMWFLDHKINDAGIPINRRMVDNAIRLADELTEVRLKEMAKITRLDNPNSTSQLLPWLRAREYRFTDLKKGHVVKAIAEEKSYRYPDADTIRVLELRAETSQAAIKKYQALAMSMDDDDRMRYGLQFAGAQRTWRWSGRRFQAQNLKRPTPEFEKIQPQLARLVEILRAEHFEMMFGKPFDVLSTTVRNTVQAPDGKMVISADLNAIENRVLGWMANEQRILDVFRQNKDPYIAFGTYLYGENYDRLKYRVEHGEKKLRQDAKPPVLGCGYQLGEGKEFENEETGEMEATGLLGYAWNMDIKLTLEQSSHAVKTFRSVFTDVVDFWDAIERACKKCVRTGDRTFCEMLEFDLKGPFLRMRLPSGRYLWYFKPRIERKKTPWGEMKPVVTYMGLNSKNQWVRLSTYGGKLTENGDQAMSRDLLANGIRHAMNEGLDVRLHVHDEIIALSPEDKAEKQLKILIDCMCRPAKWNKDLPLAANGSFGKVWVKD